MDKLLWLALGFAAGYWFATRQAGGVQLLSQPPQQNGMQPPGGLTYMLQHPQPQQGPLPTGYWTGPNHTGVYVPGPGEPQ